MEEQAVREHIDQHIESVKRGDMTAVEQDFAEELRSSLEQVGAMLPNPVEEGLAADFRHEGDHATARITFSNSQTSITVDTRWEERDGRPRVVEVTPVSS
jgi:sulfate adenylyltransferase subunit 1 (EFTu-like GTPase family)